MNNNIIINGGTGLIGKYFIKEVLNKGINPIILTRDKEKATQILKEFSGISIEQLTYKNTSNTLKNLLNDSKAVVNFAGATIAKRKWTEEYKNILISSRVDSTNTLVSLMKECESKPKVFINMSAIGYYGYQKGIVATEETGAGEGFISELCIKWENAAFEAKSIGVRTVVLRAGIVLTHKGGALGRMVPVFKFFLGGVLGSGNQWMPWIHIKDLIELIFFAIENENFEGVFNATSPHQVTNIEFTKTLAKVLKRPAIFKIPSFMLKLILGDFAINVLEGIQVIPERALKSGFKFTFKELEPALRNLLIN
ncbi:MAG: TIGR01777 family oxidoreductase [Ignavibacteria bacterium]|nr:TIGR01777 family oxidoreductase [Ignavibacteria bacterium]